MRPGFSAIGPSEDGEGACELDLEPVLSERDAVAELGEEGTSCLGSTLAEQPGGFGRDRQHLA
ncbi:MAG: hypothetical protein H6834_18410 [Planctomycetes bacterium]|nr:hypothetical protein [Planctomycetota bacterium]